MKDQTEMARQVLRRLDRLERHMRVEMERMRLQLEFMGKTGIAALEQPGTLDPDQEVRTDDEGLYVFVRNSNGERVKLRPVE